jgi:hypothetical protein
MVVPLRIDGTLLEPDFPLSSCRHLENRLRRIRRTVMERATKIAQRASTLYVESSHIDQAFVEIIKEGGELI